VTELARRETLAEKTLRRLLLKHNVNFVFQRAFSLKPVIRKIKGNQSVVEKDLRFYVADFYLPLSAVVIEIDGSVHHNRYHQDNQRTLDLIKNRKMIRHVLRFTNKDVLYNPNRVINIILSIRPIRLTHLNSEQKQINKNINAEIARVNEIESMVKLDPDTTWTTKKKILQIGSHISL
jgi:very-short-patch-repair endonuclease